MSEEKNSPIEKIKEFIQTPRGRVIAIAGAAGTFLLVLVIVFAVIFAGGQPVDKGGQQETKPAADSRESTAAPAIDNSQPAAGTSDTTDSVNSSFEVYQTRDPFKPVVETSSSVSVPITGTTSGNSTATASAPTAATTADTTTAAKTALSLESVSNKGGINYATIKYGAASYDLKTGDRVGSSPYQVQQIGSDNVTLLYGDEPFSLKVGQEVYK